MDCLIQTVAHADGRPEIMARSSVVESWRGGTLQGTWKESRIWVCGEEKAGSPDREEDRSQSPGWAGGRLDAVGECHGDRGGITVCGGRAGKVRGWKLWLLSLASSSGEVLTGNRWLTQGVIWAKFNKGLTKSWDKYESSHEGEGRTHGR